MIITGEQPVTQGVVRVREREGFMQFHVRCYQLSDERAANQRHKAGVRISSMTS
jgi:hypothetical protein